MSSSAESRDDTVVQAGISYWEAQPATLNAVLGGFGAGSSPRVDALGSRQFLLDLIPELRKVTSTIRPSRSTDPRPQKRFRALDVGAGIGRVTADVLLHLASDVVLLEPVRSFIEEAHQRCQGTSTSGESSASGWTGIAHRTKSVCFFKGTLQDFDPSRPKRATEELPRLGYVPVEDDTELGFDIVWCQWCVGHLSDEDLVTFLKLSGVALRSSTGVIVVKDNLCSDSEMKFFNPEDSSWIRSNQAFKQIFEDARLHIVRQKIQRGFPGGLLPVKMYALRPDL